MYICKLCSTKISETRIFWETILKTQEELRNLDEETIIHVKEDSKQTDFSKEEINEEKHIEVEEIYEEFDGDAEFEVENDDENIETIEYVDEERLEETFLDPTTSQDEQMFVKTETADEEQKSTKPKLPRKKRTPYKDASTETQERYTHDTKRIDKFFKFNCQNCKNMKLETYASFKMHMRQVHNESKPFIKCCKRKMSSRTALIDHMNLHLNPEELTCPICSKVLRDSYQYKVHIERHEDPQEGRHNECQICHKRFFHPSMLRTHYLTHLSKEEKEKISTHLCPHCGKGFPKKAYRDHHVRLQHLRVYEQVCDICAKPFKSKGELRMHKEGVHNTGAERKHECTQCDAKFITAFSLRSHIKRQHEEAGLFTCEICNKQSTTLNSLRSHIKFVHTMTESHVCEVCGKGFKKPLSLKEHMTTHFGGHLYNCPYCEKTFNSNANMYSHKKRMHVEQMNQSESK